MQVISISNGSVNRRSNGRHIWQTTITYDNDTKECKSITARTQTELKKKIKEFKKDILKEYVGRKFDFGESAQVLDAIILFLVEAKQSNADVTVSVNLNCY
ncbi:hypothetical protein [Anaerovibrio sp.]|uniref:hypothetical protein n=1 Tax=Anaerovibrio sp. TaxID=1872532 RepID=UPI0025C2BFFA|nr:hypothetical protein [Anaerovibrio sp.]MBR2142713.1 hypothetical protein [Anaerovibrio sp.]